MAGVVPLPATPLRGFRHLSSDKERLGLSERRSQTNQLEGERGK